MHLIDNDFSLSIAGDAASLRSPLQGVTDREKTSPFAKYLTQTTSGKRRDIRIETLKTEGPSALGADPGVFLIGYGV